MAPALILALNAGSSSVKFAAYEDTPSLPCVLEGGLTRLHDAPRLTISFAHGRDAVDRRAGQAPMDGRAAITHVLDVLRIDSLAERVEMVGHRIVHGGEVFTDPTRLEPSTLGALQELVPLAPLHQPFNLSIVTAAMKMFPHALQIGCFDTAFHIEQPRLTRLAAALDGLDRLVFTAGIGEHAPSIRERICERAGWLGVHLYSARNARGEEVVSADDSAIEVLLIPTDEERVIAEGCRTWRESPGEFQS